MKNRLYVPGKLLAAWVIIGSFLFIKSVAAEEDWGLGLEVYGWLPIIEFETESGEKGEITRDDLLDDLEMTAMWAVRAHKGKWSLNSDFIYFKISDKGGVPLIPVAPGLAQLREAGLQAWVITPNVGYTVLHNDQQKIELYAGARYLWIEADGKIDINPILPGNPSTSRKESTSDSHWDGILGVRGNYQLSGKWSIPYSVNAGTGQSDFTWGAQTGVGYKFSKLHAIAGWRYLSYDLGDDTALEELTVNGPFVGAV